MNQKEKLFFDKLKDIFIGAKIEGESGFINLMKIKSAYFDVIFKELNKEIEEKTKDFPDFKEEMFDKLYTFFKTYFSESGSIYFNYTPLKSKVYERIYSPNKDVILFWKTHMLYYVKTDRLWNNLTIDFDENGVRYKINFDVSKLQHKKANEKREIIYELKEIKDREITFNVLYSERGRKTKIDEILRTFRKKNIHLDEERLLKLFRTYKKQNEVDYFINKNAEQFLKEQFDLWLKNYLFDDESDFSEKRLRQLKVLKEIAYKVIDFVAQFEDELVKIWNKPKFVLNSNYVITLDRIAKKEGGIELIEKIVKHKGFEKQKREWKELGILEDFDESKLFINTLNGKELSKEYQFLPIDTKYFDEDIKLELLSLFDDLDNELDGWLIHSENYQALKTVLPKFREKVQTIYIDPPFNKEQDADYFYSVKYKDATWITLLENRLQLARDILSNKGTIYVKCDYNGNMFVRLLMNEIFGQERFLSEIIWRRFTGTKSQFKSFALVTDTIYAFAKSEDWIYEQQYVPYDEKYLKWFKYEDEKGKYLLRNFYSPGDGPPRKFFGKVIPPPKGHHWRMSQEKIDEYIKEGRIVLDENGFPKLKNYLHEMKGRPLDNLIDDIHVVQGVSNEYYDFPTQNPERLIKIFIESSSYKGDLILDFFLGSGTTTAVAHKLGRRWIGIEVGEHFYPYEERKGIKAGVLVRMKEVLAGKGNHEPCGISKEVNWQGGGFFKYYDLEQYEQTLRRAVYKPSHPFINFDDKSIYQQYVFMKDLKLLDAMKLDYENNKIKINFDEIYPNIDLAETLSNLTGKWIKKIEKNSVIFEDGSRIEFDDIDFNLIKPLIWW